MFGVQRYRILQINKMLINYSLNNKIFHRLFFLNLEKIVYSIKYFIQKNKMGNMQNQEFTSSFFLKQLSIIHFALLSGQIVFAAVAYYLQNEELQINTTDILLYAMFFIAITGIIASNFIYKQQLNIIAKENSLRAKLAAFQSASIIKYALLEAPSIIAVCFYISYGNLLYLLIAGFLIIYFYFQKPTKDIIINDLSLNNEDQSKFNKHDEIIK